jgi:hypothetical protein
MKDTKTTTLCESNAGRSLQVLLRLMEGYGTEKDLIIGWIK